MAVSNVVLMLGGVALFLFGMSLMGDGLKKAAGNKLEVVLYKLSGTPVKGILLGTVVTSVIQSSSAVSIMTVGFVNSSMMTVKQAVGVIMGAIIGTSITGWIICLSQAGSLLSTESIGAVFAVIGICMKLFSKKESVKKSSDILLGFAVLMVGLKSMSQAVESVKTNPEFIALLTTFSHPLVGIAAGLIVTAILQSASASVGILQGVSVAGALTFEMVLPVILGISIGASVPVILSSVESGTNGKRTAYSYPVIEILRVLIFGIIFYSINSVVSFDFFTATVDIVDIALINSFFRLVTILVLFPFINVIERLLVKLIPDRALNDNDYSEVRKLEKRFLAYPPLAVEQSRLAINGMAEKAKLNFVSAKNLLFNYSEDEFDRINELEEVIDSYEDKIGTYLMNLTGHEMSVNQRNAVSKYLHSITDYERIGDHALNLAEVAKEIKEKSIVFSEDAVREIGVLLNACHEILDTTVRSFTADNDAWAKRIEPLEQTIDDLCIRVKDKHIERLQKGLCTYNNSYVFNDLISNIERISDHCSNIGVTLIELKDNSLASHEYGNKIKEESPEFKELQKEFMKKYCL